MVLFEYNQFYDIGDRGLYGKKCFVFYREGIIFGEYEDGDLGREREKERDNG